MNGFLLLSSALISIERIILMIFCNGSLEIATDGLDFSKQEHFSEEIEIAEEDQREFLKYLAIRLSYKTGLEELSAIVEAFNSQKVGHCQDPTYSVYIDFVNNIKKGMGK